MPSTATILCGLFLAFGVAGLLAQTDPGRDTNSPPDWGTNQPPPTWNTNQPPPDWTNSPPPLSTNLPPVWTNSPPTWKKEAGGGSATNNWWKSVNALTNVPTLWSNAPGRTVPVKPGLSAARPTAPDVQSVVQQFQQDRDKLMNQFKNASESQREQLLNQLEQVRQHQREMLMNLRQQALDQANQMRNQFANPRDRLLNQGQPGGEATPGKPRH